VRLQFARHQVRPPFGPVDSMCHKGLRDSILALPVLAYFLGAGIYAFVLVLVIVIEETNDHNHEERSRDAGHFIDGNASSARVTDHNTGGYACESVNTDCHE